MFTVALIGPDGAGKTTLCRRLEQTAPMPVRYIYMGVNAEASNVMLPTTRLLRAVRRFCGRSPDAGGPRERRPVEAQATGTLSGEVALPIDGGRGRPPHGTVKNLLRRAVSSARNALRLCHLLSEEWHRQFTAWRHTRRGRVVLCDRHFLLDYYHYDVTDDAGPRPLHRRIHGFMLSRLYPRPQVVILLDAPAETLFARKGEGTIELLEQRRRDYHRLRDVCKNFYVLDATGSAEEVAREATCILRAHYRQAGPRTGPAVHAMSTMSPVASETGCEVGSATRV